MEYKHTQAGHLIVVVLITVSLIYAIILLQTSYNMTLFITFVLILLLIASFTSLQVIVDKKYLRIKFGYGIFRKRFLLRDISTVKTVKNKWYYGWGIRSWLYPPMWIFNISGFDAVEITTKQDKIYRIGTDEPKKLEKTIRQASKL